MSTQPNSRLGKVRIAVIIISLCLIVGIFAYALFNTTKKPEVLPREEIESSIQDYDGQDLGFSHTSSYLKKYGICNIDSQKINSVENILKANYYKELPKPYVLARSISSSFLESYYDKVDLTDKNAVTDAVLKCLSNCIDDQYAFYRTVDEYASYNEGLDGGSFVGIGVSVNSNTLEVLTVYQNSPAEKAGIRVGDFIIGVNGKTVDDTEINDLIKMIGGEEGTDVAITLRREDSTYTVVATRAKLTEQFVTCNLDEEKIAYISISSFTKATEAQFKEAVEYCEANGAIALVIDVRNNPGGLLKVVVNMIDYLVPDAEGRIIASYKTNSQSYEFTTTDGHSTNLPIAVICNKGTASAGELFTAAMRDFNKDGVIKAKIIGKKTYGKGVVQTSYTMHDNSGITFTIGYYNPPCNVNFDGEGIIPDVIVEIGDGASDVQLEAARSEALKMVYTNNSDTISLWGCAA